MNIPAAMQGASDFEIYVWVHQCDRVIGQIRQYTGKTTQDIRAAIDKGCRLRWGYIPNEELPQMPDGMRREAVGEAPKEKVKKTDARKNRIVISSEKVANAKALLKQGKSGKQIRKDLGIGWKTLQRVLRGDYD